VLSQHIHDMFVTRTHVIPVGVDDITGASTGASGRTIAR
jgi:hypothetical protein